MTVAMGCDGGRDGRFIVFGLEAEGPVPHPHSQEGMGLGREKCVCGVYVLTLQGSYM